MEHKLIKDVAHQYYLVVEGWSWATFTFSDKGDFFINSDYGYWACNWRSFGSEPFKKFLAEMGIDYMMRNLEQRQMTFGGKKLMTPYQKKAMTAIIAEFQRILKSELENG